MSGRISLSQRSSDMPAVHDNTTHNRLGACGIPRKSDYDVNALEYQRTKLGSSDRLCPKAKRGWSLWCEWGTWYTAKKVSKSQFGGHAYAGKAFLQGIRSCSCGCHMSGCMSSGPVDPFGPCPNNPKKGKMILSPPFISGPEIKISIRKRRNENRPL